MKQYDFSEALTQLPDDMLLEARQVKRKKPVLGRVLRAAACLCVVLGLSMWIFGGKDGIVTGPGLLTLTAYAEDNSPVFTVDSTTVSHDAFFVDGFFKWPVGVKIALSIPEYEKHTDISFRVFVDGGGAYTQEELDEPYLQGGYKMMGDEFTVYERTAIYWTQDPDWSEELRGNMKGKKQAYLRIISYAGEHIIGYSVLRFDRMTCEELAEALSRKLIHADFGDDSTEYSPDTYHCYYDDHLTSGYRVRLLESVSFPKIDGEYQNISQDYVNEKMEQIK